jgi:hypothetical protein
MRGVAIFAKACFGHPSPSKQQKLNATYACALVLSGRRAKKPIHDGSQKNELNGYS